VFDENDVKKDAAAKFRVGLMFYAGSAVLYAVAGAALIYSGDVVLAGAPSQPLLQGTAAFLFAGISLLMLINGRAYLKNELNSGTLEDISSVSLFYTIMGIFFGLGFGSAFFFLVYRRAREPEPHGNICPYCNGYVILDPTTGEAYCSRCGRRF